MGLQFWGMSVINGACCVMRAPAFWLAGVFLDGDASGPFFRDALGDTQAITGRPSIGPTTVTAKDLRDVFASEAVRRGSTIEREFRRMVRPDMRQNRNHRQAPPNKTASLI